jgi:hypothetical protein
MYSEVRDASRFGKPRAAVRRETGFALPLTLFVLTFITLLLTSAFSRASVEHRLASGSTATVKALSVAESGMQAYLGDPFANRPLAGDSVRYNVVGGYAWVYPSLMRIPADSLDDFTYVLESVGYYVEPNYGPEPLARRSIAQFVKWKQTLRRDAAYIVANGNDMYFNPPTFTVSGSDQCTSDVITGVRGPWTSDPLPGTITGAPPEVYSGSAYSVVQDLGIDWEAIENGDFVPDHTSLAAADGDTTYATYVIDEYQTDIAGIHGTGLLIVKNRIDSYGFEWDGVVIGGKDLDGPVAGTTIIRGMLVTGMDILVGDSDYPDSEFNDAHYLQVYYDSCKVARAFQKLRGFVAMENARIDNWATY